MNKSGVADQVISRPTGGGAIKGMGESFSPDLHTGTGNLSIPLALPKGRGGFQPELTLTYSTGQGNGPMGLGWSLGIPGVARDTSKQLPVYRDDDDIFLLSGAEQLVPTTSNADGITLFRPRTEGLFARIEHHRSTTDDYWEVKSRDGFTSIYGRPHERGTDSAVVRDPDDATRVFAWHLTETRDTFGNRIEYVYERDSVAAAPHRSDQLYLKTIRYADFGPRDAPRFLVSVDFVYETRPDPFSTYRAGFEIRTTRRCTRIEVRTHAETTQLVHTYHLTYMDQSDVASSALPPNRVSLLRRIQAEGIDGDATERMPPLELGYTLFEPERRIYSPLSAVGGTIPERSLAHPDFELADLFGCGLPDVVQIGDVARYWRNLGGGRFDVPRELTSLPPGVRLGDLTTQLADFDGDGQIDLLLSGSTVNGYFPLTAEQPEAARSFVSHAVAPPFALEDPELRLVDLDGDGVTDALRTGNEFELYFHDRELGWNRFETRTRDSFDRFPDVRFSDPRVKLADMSGDGLQDIVFVAGERVDYWPYLGNGRWGRRITMAGRIQFPDGVAFGGIGFDPKRLLLADVDGDGLADLVYVESGRVTIWVNQSGNGWSEPIVVRGTPPVTNADAVRVVDILGQGTAGILWTYDFGTFADSSYKFLDLTGGIKPYLLNERDNHTGARTLIEYAPSTRFYLEDERRPETRWRSRLPFPVQVVARVEALDEISRGKLTTEYRYHQGYWDGDEREFRGFGIVEQVDTETFARYHGTGLHGAEDFETIERFRFSPPTLTRTFFHQGQVQDRTGAWHEADHVGSMFPGDPQLFAQASQPMLASIAREASLNADPKQYRHALRALRGSLIRSELYALDGLPSSTNPYTVTESSFDVREIEAYAPAPSRRLRVFSPFQNATRMTQWERGEEPMTRVTFTGGHDEYGMPHEELVIGVPRGHDSRTTNTVAGDPLLATFSVTEYARRDDANGYIVNRTAHVTSYEVPNDGKPSVFELRDAVFTGSAPLTLVGHTRSFYDGPEFVGLPLGELGNFGAIVRTEALAFTDEFLARTFDPAERPAYLDPATPTAWPSVFPTELATLQTPLAGYVHYTAADVPNTPAGYFVQTTRIRYDFHEPARVPRGLQLAVRDPLGTDSSVDYDELELLPVRATNAIGLTISAEYDLRTLAAKRITDANGNVGEFAFSPLGLLTAEWVRGKGGEGDRENPSVRREYDLLAFMERRQPLEVRTLQRTHHDSETDVPLETRNEIIESVQYSDGFGRLLQSRSRAEDTLFGDEPFGHGALPANHSDPVSAAVGRTRESDAPANVIVSGWQRYDNKGRVVEKYEPFFSRGFAYQAPTEAELGQKLTKFYDPRGQVVRTLHPDGSEQRVVYGVPRDLANPDDFVPTAWEAYSYDANDNAGRTHGGTASGYGEHWNTPASIVVDALGRTVTAVARNGFDPATQWFATHSTYDIQGSLLAITDALGRVTFRYVHDLLKRTWQVESIDAGRRDSVFDALGNLVEARDARGGLRLPARDVLQRPIRLWARDDTESPLTLRQRVEYGDGSSLGQASGERAAARARNLLGQITRHHDDAGLSTFEDIDFKGNVLEKSRRVIADAPLLAVFESGPSNGWQITPFHPSWEPAPGQSLAALEGMLLDTTVYQTSTTYDALNRIQELRLPEDVEGQRRRVRPTYNASGALDHVFLDDTLYVDRIAYDAKGQRTLIAYGNGLMTRYAYDPHTFRLKRLRTERYAAAGRATYAPSGNVLQDCGYIYDLSGNILEIRDRAPGGGILQNPDAATTLDSTLAQLLASGDALVRRFTYDPLYRLLSATGRECDRPSAADVWLDTPRCTDITKTRAYTERYTYDRVGRLERLEHGNGTEGFTRELTLESSNNRIRSMKIRDGVTRYAFDANGNMTAEGTSRHFEWNYGNELKAFRTQTGNAEPSVHAQYLYDAAGQRMKKLVRKQGGQIEVTHYIDGTFEHHRWGRPGQTFENNHVHVMDDQKRIALLRIGEAHPQDRGPGTQYHLGDVVGSSTVVADSSGAMTNREEFTPYGESSFGSFAKKRYRFTGKERDEESGLNYHGARYYASWLAAWSSPDPLGSETPTYSPYCYGAANPLRYTDPLGLQVSDAQRDLINQVQTWHTDVETLDRQNNLHAVEERHAAFERQLEAANTDMRVARARMNREPDNHALVAQAEDAAGRMGKAKAGLAQTRPLLARWEGLAQRGHVLRERWTRLRMNDLHPPLGDVDPRERGPFLQYRNAVLGEEGGGGGTGNGAGLRFLAVGLGAIVFALSTKPDAKTTDVAVAYVTQEAGSMAVEALLGRTALRALGVVFLFSGLRSDNADFNAQQERYEMERAARWELSDRVDAFWFANPWLKRETARQVVEGSLATPELRMERKRSEMRRELLKDGLKFGPPRINSGPSMSPR
jgi:RHS repeat-associated protein